MKEEKTMSDWKTDDHPSKLSLATDRETEEVDFDRLTWLDTEEAATYLRKTPNALRIMVNRGYLRPRRFRRRLYFRRIELDRLLESSTY